MNLVSEQIHCINHKRKNINLDPKTFQIICLECEKEGKRGNENLKISEGNQINKKEKSQKNEEEYFCYKYPGEAALFYCDDCSVFIGTKCFVLEHRNHNCSTPELLHDSLGKEMSLIFLKSSTNAPITIYQRLRGC